MQEWNENQRLAIIHKDGPMMVLAGPGAGKTLVITHRTRYLIEHHQIDPRNILVITFTRMAAREMKQRFQKLTGEQLPVSFGTFHSVFFMMLKYAYHFNAGHILPESKKYQLLKEIIIDHHIEIEDEANFLQGIISEISMVKGQMIDIAYYHSSNCSDEIFADIYEAYQEKLHLNRWIDFDDILVYTYELLKEREDIRKMWQDRFQYILVDEFQDINRIQYEIIKMLAAPRNNLFIVGDDDQSIYRFRGANPEIMLGFTKDYESAKKVTLDINYRSEESIVRGAKEVIQKNTHRYDKDIKAVHKEGIPIDIRQFKSQYQENQWMIERMRASLQKGIPITEIAVLFRTNLNARSLVSKLMEFNIPFTMKDDIPSLYSHWIARDLMDYMKIALGDRRRSTFFRVMNRPKRYISHEYLPDYEVDFEDLKAKASGKEWLYDYIVEFEEDIRLLTKMAPAVAITYIAKSVGYNVYLRDYARFRKIPENELLDVVEELKESAKGFDTYEEWFSFIREFEEKAREKKRQKEEEEPGIVLSTYHSAKGLEFEEVFLIDVNEEVVPHKKAIKEEEIEEERRMFYVGMTRAKRYLHILSVEKLYNRDSQKSRFLIPLGKDL
ncbi:MAG: ATP-dependent helicase [Anaerostipes sp.]|nr:ATP-dependent helicase [Anaerostipes sp.]